MTTYHDTPHPDAPPPVSRGSLYKQIAELNDHYLGLACGYIKPQSAHRSARDEMKDLLAVINDLYAQIKGLGK